MYISALTTFTFTALIINLSLASPIASAELSRRTTHVTTGGIIHSAAMEKRAIEKRKKGKKLSNKQSSKDKNVPKHQAAQPASIAPSSNGGLLGGLPLLGGGAGTGGGIPLVSSL